ncbi:acyltransferase [Saccharomonospora sp. NPDC046836]|uniref:acyltransferase family protein n=1 Tax=Saccharomonospora sp. NPDC046836 TaxID=3156921 RepID=UPI0033D0F70F
MTSTEGASIAASSRRMSWDMIRVIAIIFVVLGHVTNLAAKVPGIDAYPFAVSIPFGTVTLLVLSGYFIGPTIRRGAPGRWFRARLARMLPAYLVALLLTYLAARWLVVGFNGWTHQPGIIGFLFAAPVTPEPPDPDALPPWHVPDLPDLLLHGTLLHLWNDDTYHQIDGSWWTMPVQVLAFAGAALLWRSRVRHTLRPQTVLWIIMGVAAASPLLGVVWDRLPIATGLFYAYLFAVGMAIWLWQRRRLTTPHLLAMLLTAVVLHALRTNGPKVASVIGFAIMLGLMCLAARGPDWDLPVLRLLRKPVSWLAGISFGVYLVHQALGFQLARVLSDAGVSAWWLRLSMVVAFVLLLGWLVTVAVERPAYRVLTGARPVTSAAGGRDREPAVSVGGPT